MYQRMTFGPYRRPIGELNVILMDAVSLTTIPTDFSQYEAVIWDAQGDAAHVQADVLRGDLDNGELIPVTTERAKQLLTEDHRTVLGY